MLNSLSLNHLKATVLNSLSYEIGQLDELDLKLQRISGELFEVAVLNGLLQPMQVSTAVLDSLLAVGACAAQCWTACSL